uniref:Uncharacterized protein n=1 Tax=Anguilla anguilla TaxID=7936 RepID=A0A0E9V9M2_ANGAN
MFLEFKKSPRQILFYFPFVAFSVPTPFEFLNSTQWWENTNSYLRTSRRLAEDYLLLNCNCTLQDLPKVNTQPYGLF